jgi:NADPH:quinone reductase-like Zn-dependent oxidoreductase
MGYVTALGEEVRGLAVGDRVAWVYHVDSYAEQLDIPASSLVKVPDEVNDETAAAMMMQGLTANHFTTETYAPTRASSTTAPTHEDIESRSTRGKLLLLP